VSAVQPSVVAGASRSPVPTGARAEHAHASSRAVVAFFVLAFAWSWGWWIPLATSSDLVERGQGSPTHVPGLFGPMLAAAVVLLATGRRDALAAWARALVRIPRDRRWIAASISPLGFLAIGAVVAALAGNLAGIHAFGRFSGMSVAVAPALLLLGAVGEEAGWRGFALPRLQARLGALRATLLLTALWALWHVPLFYVIAGYRGFSPMMVPGFVIGLGAGALVLTAIFNHTGGSVLAVAVWHASYNLASASDGTDGAIAAVVTACVITWGIRLVIRERAGRRALGDEPAMERADR
jgi:membrane protease YdiL (CAAX protease family)